jgi:uncharacterized repeat protein (TIGR03803 family)
MRYWITICLFCAACGISPAQTFTTLAYFTNGVTVPSSLVQGRDGNFYGTSNNGGTYGDGTVFKVTPAGVLTTLYNFCSHPSCVDGYYPFAALVVGKDGNFYGTTQNGGASGLGTVFRITPGGAYTVLHSFQGLDGAEPDAGLVLAGDGNFYGTAANGGEPGGAGGGTIFRITPAGSLTTLHAFNRSSGTASGDIPIAPLILGEDENLYGTTLGGGVATFWCTYIGPSGCGTVFKITTNGTFTNLLNFDLSDGALPYAPVTQARDGNLYGVTFAGGFGYGTIFKTTTSGELTVMHRFGFDQGNIYAGLVSATDGNLYGQDPETGIFQLTPGGAYTTECKCGGSDTPLMQSTNGEFYGAGGSEIYSFDISLGPFVAFVLPTGKVGATAQILGQGLTGTSSVTFNGVEATAFKVVSDTYMTAVVPSGATTGPVVVTTPSGALTSNVSFRIVN